MQDVNNRFQLLYVSVCSHFPCRNSASRQYCLMVFPYVQFLVVSVFKSVSQVNFGEVCLTTWSSHLKWNRWFQDILSCKSSVAVKSQVSFCIIIVFCGQLCHIYNVLLPWWKKRQRYLLSNFINRESTILTIGKKIYQTRNIDRLDIYFFSREASKMTR